MNQWFPYAFQMLMEHEGGFVNHPSDPGGATKYGISLRWLKLQGEIGDIDDDGDVDVDDIRALSPEMARDFYRIHWWDRYGYAHLNNREVAAKIFDLAVNMGGRQAHKLLQRACCAAGYPAVDDGILGPKTLKAANSSDAKILLGALRSEAACFYRSLHKPEFIKGWLRRAYA